MNSPKIPSSSVSTKTESTRLPSTETSVTTPKNFRCLIASDFWYYDRWLEPIEPPEIYEYLLSTAKNLVWIWDPYVKSEDLKLLSHINNEVKVKVLSYWGQDRRAPRKKRVQDLINEVSTKYLSWGFDIELKYYNTYYDTESIDPFHDRYLFIDNDVYMVGASLTNHHKRNSSTAIIKIVPEDAKLLLRERFNECWNHQVSEHLLLYIGGLLTV
ncbi:hypothetical protein P4361_08045 [Fictibacillus sp. B-59209]|uniref:hypothetical protein n=1 Tax=Fictibacillus sp. B-59209 TaxID=3024873 RepID=UPI002E218905|nr:hypothetical protein [Fictibacillus sp. B-59209]